jgi:Chlorophyllase enzyme
MGRFYDNLVRLGMFYSSPEPSTAPPASCEISWQPSGLAPVFYGVRDYEAADGAPLSCRVFFPSLDGAVFEARLLEGCGRYPLILFAHGDCSELDHYKKWFELPAQLARSGYIVVVPQLVFSGLSEISIPVDITANVQRLSATLAWLREQWEYRQVLLPSANGIIGHSRGGVAAASFAQSTNLQAYASLSGVWNELPSETPLPITSLDTPKLLMWGTGFDVNAQLSEAQWAGLPVPRHRVTFSDGAHWDYLPSGRTSCQGALGSCNLVLAIAGDLATMFFSKYLPPEKWPGLSTYVANILIPPIYRRTMEQNVFAGTWLPGLFMVPSRPECSVTLTYATSSRTYTTTWSSTWS